MPDPTPSLSGPFAYRKPTDEQARRMQDLSVGIDGCYHQLLVAAGSSDDRATAILKLREFRMWANAAILNIGGVIR